MRCLGMSGRLLMLAALLLVSGWSAQPGAAQADQRCFNETGYCIAGRIRAYWEQNGGLPVFGFPIGPQHAEQVEGTSYQVQWFERERLELHPENAPPYDVLLGRLGVDQLQRLDRPTFIISQPQTPPPNCDYFGETEQLLCAPFRDYFHAHGLQFDSNPAVSLAESIALFGLPLTPPAQETNPNGDRVLTQWFERARLEYHPNNPAPFQVQLGLLGDEVHGAALPAVPTPTGPDTSTLPTPWLARLNAYRTAAGLPAVTEDARLSAGDTKHVQYMLLHPNTTEHDEATGQSGYSPEGQTAAQQSNLFRAGLPSNPDQAIDVWMDSLFHRFGILNPVVTRVGFAFACNGQGCAAALNILGAEDGTPRADGVSYPGAGQRGVATRLISWQFGSFDPTVTVSSATLRDSHGALVPTTLTRPDGFWNVIALTPTNPLAAGATYTVEMSATQDGKPLHKLGSFQTK